MSKTAAPEKVARSLSIRKRRDGSVTIDGGLPPVHDFSARWIDRNLGDLVEVTITLLTRDAEGNATPITYQLTGYAPILDRDGNPVVEDVEGEPTVRKNYTALSARHIEVSDG